MLFAAMLKAASLMSTFSPKLALTAQLVTDLVVSIAAHSTKPSALVTSRLMSKDAPRPAVAPAVIAHMAGLFKVLPLASCLADFKICSQ